MSISLQLKKQIIDIMPRSIIDFLRNQLSLAIIPRHKESVISDLFPFRIHDGWETHFELLNVPVLIDPIHQIDKVYNVRLIFFDENGVFIHEWIHKEHGCNRQTICLNDIIKDKSISGYGTFACFHQNYLECLQVQGGFLAERGYTGYSNKNFSIVKGYVHGNLDAIALNKNGELLCLGKSFVLRKNEYRLQHLLEGPATYEFGFVNTSASEQYLFLEIISKHNQSRKTEKKHIPSRGVIWFYVNVTENDPLRVIVHSKLNLPRPVIFRLENKSFDVFHG